MDQNRSIIRLCCQSVFLVHMYFKSSLSLLEVLSCWTLISRAATWWRSSASWTASARLSWSSISSSTPRTTRCLRRASCWGSLFCRGETRRYRWVLCTFTIQHFLLCFGKSSSSSLPCLPTPDQNSFHHQLHKQKNSEKFFKVFFDRMNLAQQEIRATVSVNMFEVGCRKTNEGDVSSRRARKGRLTWWRCSWLRTDSTQTECLNVWNYIL